MIEKNLLIALAKAIYGIRRKTLLFLLLSITFNPFSLYSETVRDSAYFDGLIQKFDGDDMEARSSIIDFYIDSVGATSNDFLKFITFVATPSDFSKQQKARIFDTVSTKYNDTRILTLMKFFKDKTYIPIVKQWYAKSDKRGRFMYESLLFEFDDSCIWEQWEVTMRNCTKASKVVPTQIARYLPVICGKLPNRRLCNCLLDFIIDHQNQYFVTKDQGITEFDDVVYFMSFFLSGRLKGFPDAFMFSKFEHSNSNERYVSFSKVDKETILKWCKMHRRDYEFEQ